MSAPIVTRILLVEDDRTLGETLTERLTRTGYQTTWVTTAKDAADAFTREEFDLVIFDVGLPDGSGFELANSLRRKKLVPFIFVTAQGAAEDRLRGYELGAEEYIPKPFHLREFLLRVKHVLENHAIRRTLRIGAVTVDWAAMTVKHNDQQEKLSLREIQVLKTLYDRAPDAVSRDELLNRVWGEDEFPTNRTVDNVIVRLRQALGSEADRIVSVRGVGYQWIKKDGE